MEKYRADSHEENLLIYGYFPIESGKMLHIDTPIEMALPAINRNEYGTIEGKVTAVSLYALSKENVLNEIQNIALTEYLTNSHSAVIKVVIQPKHDPRNPKNLIWTSGLTPPIRTTTGTVGTIEATVERFRPIYYLLPLEQFKVSDKNEK